MRRILVIRHGESEWNREGRWQGWEDVALTAEGEGQAAARGHALAADASSRIVTAFTSDLCRAWRTAEIITAILGLPPAVAEPGLRERDVGAWQGYTGDQIDERWPGLRAAWRRGELDGLPGGETHDQVLTRVDAAMARCAAAAPGDGAALVVTHHGVLRMLSTRAGVSPTEIIPNLGGRWFTWDAGVMDAGEALAPLAPSPDSAATE